MKASIWHLFIWILQNDICYNIFCMLINIWLTCIVKQVIYFQPVTLRYFITPVRCVKKIFFVCFYIFDSTLRSITTEHGRSLRCWIGYRVIINSISIIWCCKSHAFFIACANNVRRINRCRHVSGSIIAIISCSTNNGDSVSYGFINFCFQYFVYGVFSCWYWKIDDTYILLYSIFHCSNNIRNATLAVVSKRSDRQDFCFIVLIYDIFYHGVTMAVFTGQVIINQRNSVYDIFRLRHACVNQCDYIIFTLCCHRILGGIQCCNSVTFCFWRDAVACIFWSIFSSSFNDCIRFYCLCILFVIHISIHCLRSIFILQQVNAAVSANQMFFVNDSRFSISHNNQSCRSKFISVQFIHAVCFFQKVLFHCFIRTLSCIRCIFCHISSIFFCCSCFGTVFSISLIFNRVRIVCCFSRAVVSRACGLLIIRGFILICFCIVAVFVCAYFSLSLAIRRNVNIVVDRQVSGAVTVVFYIRISVAAIGSLFVPICFFSLICWFVHRQVTRLGRVLCFCLSVLFCFFFFKFDLNGHVWIHKYRIFKFPGNSIGLFIKTGIFFRISFNYIVKFQDISFICICLHICYTVCFYFVSIRITVFCCIFAWHEDIVFVVNINPHFIGLSVVGFMIGQLHGLLVIFILIDDNFTAGCLQVYKQKLCLCILFSLCAVWIGADNCLSLTLAGICRCFCNSIHSVHICGISQYRRCNRCCSSNRSKHAWCDFCRNRTWRYFFLSSPVRRVIAFFVFHFLVSFLWFKLHTQSLLHYKKDSYGLFINDWKNTATFWICIQSCCWIGILIHLHFRRYSVVRCYISKAIRFLTRYEFAVYRNVQG